MAPGSPNASNLLTAPGSQKIHPMVVCTDLELRALTAFQSVMAAMDSLGSVTALPRMGDRSVGR